MKFAGIFVGQPIGLQLLALLLLVVGGSILSSLLGMGLFMAVYGVNAQITDYPDMLRLLQLITAAGTFLLPAALFAYLYSDDFQEYLSMRKRISWKSAALVFANIVWLLPVINLLSWLNEKLTLPSWAAAVESWMQTYEEQAQEFTQKLIDGGGVCPYLSNLLVIALMAAIAEEFLFRGTLQRIISQWKTNHHAVIWLVAILFSAFHLQFYGFLPRMILGAYFGYLLWWSKSIWLPVCAHFFNNAISVTLMSSDAVSDSEFVTAEIGDDHIVYYGVLALVSLILFVWTNHFLKKKLGSQPTIQEF